MTFSKVVEVDAVHGIDSYSELAYCHDIDVFDLSSVTQLQVEASSNSLVAVSSDFIVADA